MANGRQMLIGCGVFSFIMVMSPLAFAADGDGVAEVAPSQDTTLQHASRDQVFQTIEATRAADPELASEMERQLHLMDSGEATLAPSERDLQGGTPTADATTRGEVFGFPGGTTGSPELIGPPVDSPSNFEQVQSDPRMQDIHQQFEGGQLSEGQAREKMSEVLRDHGIEPNNGREWERQGEYGEHGQHGERGEHSENFERTFERMSTEGREHHKETMQRELESTERTSETPTREYEAPSREHESPEQMHKASERTHEASEHQYEGQTHQ